MFVACQRRVKLTLELSFLRRASRWSAPSAKARRRVVGTATGTIRTNRSAVFATTDRYVTRVDPTLQYFIIFVSSQPDPNTRGALFRSSLPAMASASNAVRMGQIQANCEARSSKRTRGTVCRVSTERCAFRGSSSFFLSPCPSDIHRHDNFRHKLFRLDSRRSSSIFFAGAGHYRDRGDDVREVRDGYDQCVARLQRKARN